MDTSIKNATGANNTSPEARIAHDTSLQEFCFDKSVKVRMVVIGGELWFVAGDVMDALEYSGSSNPSRAVAHVPEQWVGVHPIHTSAGMRQACIISEQGLYFFLGRSDKPKAFPFQKWLAGEVLPTFRKTGTYSAPGVIADKDREIALWRSRFGSALKLVKHMNERNASLVKLITKSNVTP